MQRTLRLISALALAAAMTLGLAGAASAQGVRILGRSAGSSAGGFTIQWPSSGFEAKLTGKKLTITLEDWGGNWLNVTVDGVTTRLDLENGIKTYTLFDGAPGEHVVRVTRRTGAPVGPTRIIDIKADGKLAPTASPDRRILVIGDSITAGYGVEGADQTCHYTHDTQNAAAAYPALVAQTFGADLQNVSSDGRGLIRNYSGDDLSMDMLAWRILPDSPAIFPSTFYRPQVIVVNLGANDFANGDPGQRFDDEYVTLLRRLRRAYPEATIFGTFGSMLTGDAYTAAKTSVSGAVNILRKEGDLKAQFIEFTPPAGNGRFGCDWHPGMAAHAAMAEQLEAAIQKATGWSTVSKPQAEPLAVWNSAKPSGPATRPISRIAPPVPARVSLKESSKRND